MADDGTPGVDTTRRAESLRACSGKDFALLERTLGVAWSAAVKTQFALPEDVVRRVGCGARSPEVASASVVRGVAHAQDCPDFATAYDIVDGLEQSATSINRAAMTCLDGARQLRFPSFCSGARRAEERVREGDAASPADVSLACAYRDAVGASNAWIGRWAHGVFSMMDHPTAEQAALLQQAFAGRALATAFQLAAKLAAKQLEADDTPRWIERIEQNVRIAAGGAWLDGWGADHAR